MFNRQSYLFLFALRSTFKFPELNLPTISSVAGEADGSGLELAVATHFRKLSTAAWVSLPKTRLGIIPGAGRTHRLRSVISESRVLELILTGRIVSGRKSYSCGLCQRVVRAS